MSYFDQAAIDYYYANCAPCPGCAATWQQQGRDYVIDHRVGCVFLAQLDEELDDEIALD